MQIVDSDDDDDATSVASILSAPPSVAATSVTSHDCTMRSASPVPSVISMTSSMREQMLRQEYGRNLNNYSDVYYLPADDDEFDRLGMSISPFLLHISLSVGKQYYFMTAVMGKYVPPFHEVMRNEGPGTDTKRCLDLGCGSGAWQVSLLLLFTRSGVN